MRWRSALGALAAVVVVLALSVIEVTRRLWVGYFAGPADPSVIRRDKALRIGEPLSVLAANGKPINARFLPGAGGGLIVLAPGYRRPMTMVIDLGRRLRRHGYDVAMFSWRGCANDEIDELTAGVRERRDLEAVVAAARERAGTRDVGLLGLSMGATLCLMVAADDPEVVAVWADSPMTNPIDVFDEMVRRRLHVPGRVVAWAVAAWVLLRRGVRIWTVCAEPAAARVAPRPIHFVLSGADAFVPPEQSLKIIRAAGAAASVSVIDGASHGAGWLGHPEEYARQVDAFFRTASRVGHVRGARLLLRRPSRTIAR